MDQPEWDGIYARIGASERGRGFYQHSTCVPGRHLGRRVTMGELTKELREIILNEINETV